MMLTDEQIEECLLAAAAESTAPEEEWLLYGRKVEQFVRAELERENERLRDALMSIDAIASRWIGRPSARERVAMPTVETKPQREWATYNPLTATYNTPDGTSIAAELADNVQCLADVLHIAAIRAKQRAERLNDRS